MKQDIITKAISFFSPKAALSRIIDREKLRNFGRFDSALVSEKRGISRGVSGAEDTSGTRERFALIRAARDLADNFPPVRSILLKFSTYVAGRIAYQARTGDKQLDSQIENFWQKWTENCDFQERHNFTTLLQLAVMAVLRDGDCGFVIVRDKDGLKLQSVEADRIGSPYDRTDTDNYIGGVTIDEFGKPDGYTIFVRTINNQYISPVEISSKEFVHVFDPTRLDEYRGRSSFSSALNATRDLQEAIKAEVQAIKYASYQSGVITTESGAADPSDYFSKAVGDNGQEQKIQTLEAGSVHYLGSGEKMEMFKSDRPTGAFGEFIKLIQAHICMSVGLPYGFAFDADKSGPMARMESAMAERTFARWRGLLESQFLNRIKNIVLLDAASRGVIPFSDNLLDGKWNWPAKVSIDYGREATADIALWKAGLKTAAQIYNDLGEDYEDALRARAKEALFIKELSQEYDVAPARISDSVPTTTSDMMIDKTKTPPLVESIGVGGTMALSQFLSSLSNGGLSVGQVAVILKSVFGMDQESVDQIVSQQAPEQSENVESDFVEGNSPTQGMVEEAKKGLEWRKKFKRGGTAVGVARARDISNKKNLSDETVKRMNSYFSRHEVDKKGKGFYPTDDGFPSAGRIAWALWGGDAGKTWAARKLEQIKKKNLECKKDFIDPIAGESQEDFVTRCMSDERMKQEYPDADQRLAVCYARAEGEK